MGHKSNTKNVSQAHMADILQQQQLWPQDRMWVNLTPAQKCSESGQPTPTIVLSSVNNTLNLAEKANLSQRRRNALLQPPL